MVDQTRSGDPSRAALDRRTELGQFLRTRRGALKPEDLGLLSFGRRRRVPGLRREEVAQVAGVSVAYYTRLEQGHSDNVSAEVLDAIARALRLTDAQQLYLTQLAKPKPDRKRTPCTRSQQLRPALQQLLDALDVPAYVTGRRADILGWNRLAAALFGNWSELPPHERNWARLVFLSPTTRDLFVDRDGKAAAIVSMLRVDASRCPDDPQLAALVGELSVKSEEFRRLWAAYELRRKSHGSLRLTHPLVGDLTLSYEIFPLPDDPDQALLTYHAEPDSASADALRLLANWGTDATTPIH
ncbi:helix-turn-helix transcriptional regulator [Micromonospora sp. CPCC 205371]|nr:helix-turn-helix transcriptional regulator [Micromonospora sp. CPCC 205371]